MSLNSLRDLAAAGVKWELAETVHIQDQELTPKAVSKTNNVPRDSIPKPSAENTVVPPSAPIALDAAKSLVEKITDVQALMGAIRDFDHPLRQFVKNVVLPHVADTPCGLMIITDAPGSDDDATGQILTGAAGDLMDKMLTAIHLDRTMVSIVPLVFWRTPGGRTPTREEIDLARPFVNRAIDLLAPMAILSLGTLTAAELVHAKLPKNHGDIISDVLSVPVIPIYHPNYLILKPEAKRDVWAALQKLQNLLKNCEE